MGSGFSEGGLSEGDEVPLVTSTSRPEIEYLSNHIHISPNAATPYVCPLTNTVVFVENIATSGHTVFKYASNGSLLWSAGTGHERLSSRVTIDRNGTIYLSADGTSLIVRIDKDGNLLSSISTGASFTFLEADGDSLFYGGLSGWVKWSISQETILATTTDTTQFIGTSSNFLFGRVSGSDTFRAYSKNDLSRAINIMLVSNESVSWAGFFDDNSFVMSSSVGVGGPRLRKYTSSVSLEYILSGVSYRASLNNISSIPLDGKLIWGVDTNCLNLFRKSGYLSESILDTEFFTQPAFFADGSYITGKQTGTNINGNGSRRRRLRQVYLGG